MKNKKKDKLLIKAYPFFYLLEITKALKHVYF